MTEPFRPPGAKARRPRILLALFNNTAAQGIFDSKSLGVLRAYADVDLVHALPMEVPEGYFGSVVQWPRIHRREMMWLALYQLHLLPFTREHYPERKGDQNLWQGFRPHVRRMVIVADHALGRALAVPVLRAYLARTNPFPRLIDRKYDAFVCITGLKDPMYEDLVRFARDTGTPVLGITQNWDNVNYKPIVERPDVLGVWGMQGYYVARLVHGFAAERLKLVGVPRLDPYFDPLPEHQAARAALSLPEDHRILLFAGAGPPFDEAFVLKTLNTAIDRGDLPPDTMILYKPHPRRSGTAPAVEERLDHSSLRNVRVLPATGPGSVSGRGMPELLRAVDGVISPFSTVMLEGALCGRPCVVLAYDDPAHSAWPWASVRRYIYVAPFSLARWSVVCTGKSRVVEAVARLLTLTRDAELARRAREDMIHIVFNDGRDFAARVCDAIDDLLQTGGAESGTLPIQKQ